MALILVTVADITVSTAGTRVQVSATATPVSSIIFEAHASNTGVVYIGDASVAATRGTSLAAGQALAISADQSGRDGEEFFLSDFYVDAATNGDKVKVSYIKRR